MGSYGGGSGGYPGCLGGGVSRKQWCGETTEEEPHGMYIIWDYGCMDGGGRLIRCDVKVMGGKAKRGPNSCPYLLFNKPVCYLLTVVYMYISTVENLTLMLLLKLNYTKTYSFHCKNTVSIRMS